VVRVPENFYLDPEAVRRIAAGNRTTHDNLDGAFAELQRVLDANDGCWGSDDVGENFAKNYVETADGTRDSSTDMVTALDDLSTGLESAVDGFTGLDAENAQAVDHDMADQLNNPPES
jgi:uncharacterized protein YukE